MEPPRSVKGRPVDEEGQPLLDTGGVPMHIILQKSLGLNRRPRAIHICCSPDKLARVALGGELGANLGEFRCPTDRSRLCRIIDFTRPVG